MGAEGKGGMEGRAGVVLGRRLVSIEGGWKIGVERFLSSGGIFIFLQAIYI